MIIQFKLLIYMYWGKEWLEAADAHNQKQLHNFLGVGTTSITHSCYVEEYQIINICFNIISIENIYLYL